MSQLILLLASSKRARLNKFQLKSLAILCFDPAKILGASPLLKFFEAKKISLDRADYVMLLSIVVVFGFLVLVGLFFAEKVKER